MQTMKMMKRYHVQIGDPVNRTFHPTYEIDVHALLWACAKGPDFIPAIATMGRKHFQNAPLRDEPLPDAEKFLVLCERIGYWETALEHDDPEILLEAAVVSALSSFHDLLRSNPLAAEPEKFITTITQAARAWAEDLAEKCFTHHP